MMDQLLRRADELRPGLQDILSTLISANVVQGAVLEVDRYWFDYYTQRYARRTWEDDLYEEALFYLYNPREWDFNLRPPGWDRHMKVMGYPEGSGPLIVRVILYPPTEHKDNVPLTDGNSFPRSFAGSPLIYETRPVLEALSLLERVRHVFTGISPFSSDVDGQHSPAVISVGKSVPKPTAGTLGGFLRCPVTNKRYLVSCAHVLGDNNTLVYTPGPYENRGMDEIGIVQLSQIPPLQGPGQPCNQWAMPNGASLDVAVAEILPGGPLSEHFTDQPRWVTLRLACSMTPNDRVSFTGKVSGRVSAYLGGCTIWHSINFADGPRCFTGLFEIVAPRGARRPLAKKGDSGAWIEDFPADPACWNGMLVSAVPDGDRAYCCFAEHILEACSLKFPAGLALVS